MSIISRYFNTQAAAPSWRVAKWSAGVGLIAAANSALGWGGAVVTDLSAYGALISAVVSGCATLNGVRRGFSERPNAPSPV